MATTTPTDTADRHECDRGVSGHADAERRVTSHLHRHRRRLEITAQLILVVPRYTLTRRPRRWAPGTASICQIVLANDRDRAGGRGGRRDNRRPATFASRIYDATGTDRAGRRRYLIDV